MAAAREGNGVSSVDEQAAGERASRRFVRAGTPLTTPDPPRAISETEARRVWTLSCRASGLKCSWEERGERSAFGAESSTIGRARHTLPIAAEYEGNDQHESRRSTDTRALTSSNDTFGIALPIQPTPGLLDGLRDITRHSPPLGTGHQTLGTQCPGKGRIPIEQAEQLGGGDELVGAQLARDDLVNQFLASYDIGAGCAGCYGRGTLSEDD